MPTPTPKKPPTRQEPDKPGEGKVDPDDAQIEEPKDDTFKDPPTKK
jgi:hypothetical protein